MSFELVEGAVDTIKDYLDTNMGAKLDALDLEYDDGITLADINGYYVAELPAIPEYPAVVIVGINSSPEEEGDGWLSMNHSIMIGVITTDQDNQTLRRRIYRYIRAIVELLIAARSTQGFVINIDDIDYTPIFGREGTFIQDAQVTITMRKFETA